MNIGEFLNYRKLCPICNNGLSASFLPARRNTVRYEDGRLLITSDMSGMKRGQSDYKVGYSFSLDDNSFVIEFFNDVGDPLFYNSIPVHLIDKFKKLDANLGGIYQISMQCASCHRYRIESSFFALDFKTSTIEDIRIDLESVGLSISYEGKFKIMIMSNFYPNEKNDELESRTKVHYWQSNTDDSRIDFIITQINQPNSIWLPLVPFVSKEKTSERLNTLLTFS